MGGNPSREGGGRDSEVPDGVVGPPFPFPELLEQTEDPEQLEVE